MNRDNRIQEIFLLLSQQKADTTTHLFAVPEQNERKKTKQTTTL